LFVIFLVVHPEPGHLLSMLFKAVLVCVFFVLAVVARALEPSDVRETVRLIRKRWGSS